MANEGKEAYLPGANIWCAQSMSLPIEYSCPFECEKISGPLVATNSSQHKSRRVFNTLADGLEHVMPRVRATLAANTGSLNCADNILEDYLLQLLSNKTDDRPPANEHDILSHIFKYCESHSLLHANNTFECYRCMGGTQKLFAVFQESSVKCEA